MRGFFLVLLIPTLLLSQGPGFPNITRVKGEMIGVPFASDGGRTAVIAYHQGYLITQYEAPGSAPGSNGMARFFDISDPANPVQTTFNAGFNSAISAHGYWQEGAVIRGFQNWTFSGNSIVQINNDAAAGGTFYSNWSAGYQNVFPWPGRGLLFQPWHMSEYWSYGTTTHNSGLFKRNTLLVSNWNPVTETGVIGHPVLLGNYLYYLSDQSDTGIAIYDITPSLNNPGTNPQLIGLFKDPVNPAIPAQSVGAYWPEMWGGDGKLKVLFPDRNDGVHIVDVTDPSNIFRELTHFTPYQNPWWSNPDPAYAQFQDEYGFTDRFKINMLTLEVESLIDNNAHGIDVSQFALPIGNLLVTGGIYLSPLGNISQAAAIWVHQSEPDTRAPTVGYHVPRTGQLNYHRAAPISVMIHETLRSETLINGQSFIIRQVYSDNSVGSFVPGRLVLAFDDVITFTPDSDLQADTTYEVLLSGGGIADAVGNTMNQYRYRFSTGSTLIGDAGDTPGDTTPPDNNTPDDDIYELDLMISKKAGLPKIVSFIMPKAIRRLIDKDPLDPSITNLKRAVIKVKVNGSKIAKVKVYRKKTINVELDREKLRSKLIDGGPNTINVTVSVSRNLMAEGDTDF